jgi:hypothetical protein
MFHFTIRDLLWLIVVVALALSMCVQQARHDITLGIVRRHAAALQHELRQAAQNEAVC